MRFHMGKKVGSAEVAVGNVYPAKGGNKTKCWLIISVTGNSAHALGLNDEGVITSTTSYGLHAFEGREIIGRCPAVADMEFDIEEF